MCINASFITLIPKCFGLTDFEEIHIDQLGGKCLQDFSKILDCFLIVNEIIKAIQKDDLEAIFLNVDLKKPYDSVNLDFLDIMIGKMSFC